MVSIRRLTLGLVLGLTCGVGSLAAMPAGAQILINCGMTQPGLPPGAQIACGTPGVFPSVVGPQDLPPGEPWQPTGGPCERDILACVNTAGPDWG